MSLTRQYSLHHVTQGRLLILLSTPSDTSEPITAECELYFSRTLKRGGCFLTEPRLASWKEQQ